MATANLEYVLKKIRKQFEDGDYSPVTLIGKAGIGTTEALSGLAREMGIGFSELRLSIYQESDLVGNPYLGTSSEGLRQLQTSGIVVANGDAALMTKHAHTTLLPPSDDPNPGILLLDEVTSASRGMRTAAYQLLDKSRKLGEYKLPEKWMIVACGNGPDDGGNFVGMEAAFLSRGMAWRVEPNASVWTRWAVKNNVNPTIIAYIKFDPSKIYCVDPDDPYAMIVCPRNWTKLSVVLNNMEKRSPSGIVEDKEDLELTAAGCVGAQEGPSFSAFYYYNKEVVSPQDIIDGKVDPRRMMSLSREVVYITAQKVTDLLKKLIESSQSNISNSAMDLDKLLNSTSDADPKVIDKVANTINFFINLTKIGFKTDVVVGIISDIAQSIKAEVLFPIITSERFIKATPDFEEFIKENSIIVN